MSRYERVALTYGPVLSLIDALAKFSEAAEDKFVRLPYCAIHNVAAMLKAKRLAFLEEKYKKYTIVREPRLDDMPFVRIIGIDEELIELLHEGLVRGIVLMNIPTVIVDIDFLAKARFRLYESERNRRIYEECVNIVQAYAPISKMKNLRRMLKEFKDILEKELFTT